jgi:hypothetical protein
MAEIINKGNAQSLWILKKAKYPGITDLHIHQHAKGLTLTATYKGNKEHLDVDLGQTVEEFGETLEQHLASYEQRKIKLRRLSRHQHL